VYQGVQPGATLTNKSRSTLAYRVRACHSDRPRLCSGYLTGKTMIVNPRPVHNLYEKYPFLHALDQRIASYMGSVPSFRTDVPRIDVPGQIYGRPDNARIDGPRFILGDGYDVIRSGLRSFCLDPDHPGIHIEKSPPSMSSSFEVIEIRDNRHLAEVLNISEGAKSGISHEDFTMGISFEEERYSKSVTDDTYARVVVRWIYRGELWRLATPVDPYAPEILNGFIKPDNATSKVEFRERCGDEFINRAHLGAALYLVFTYNLKKYSVDARTTQKHTFGLKISDIFNGSANASVSADTQRFVEVEKIEVHADQVGGPAGLAASINRSNYAQKFNEFVQGTNPSNLGAVDFATTKYERPTIYSAYQPSQLFADYQIPYAQMRRWGTVVVQHRERCMPYAEHGRPVPPECTVSEAELGTALDMCRNTSQWADCVHPGAYRTPWGINPAGTLILGWLNDNVKKLVDHEMSQEWAHHVHRGEKSVNDNTCLPVQCFTNTFQGSGDGIGKGFEPTVHVRDNPKHPDTLPRFTVTDSNRCVNTQLYLETYKPFIVGRDSTADFNYKMRVIGFCPTFSPFVMIP
jgi:hypothetical protein